MQKLICFFSITALWILPLTSIASAYEETALSNGGMITGKVTGSKDFAPKSYKVSKDNAVCGEGKREIDFVKINNGALQDVVVYLDKVKSGKPFPADFGKGRVLQAGCEFKPFLGVMRNNSRVHVINEDPVLHNIHTYELMYRVKKTVFNVSQPEKGSITKAIKLERGTAMKVECDAHDFMHSYIFVTNNPYFAVVNADGTYEINDVPPGKYTIKAWHGYLRDQKDKVDVKANSVATIDFAFKGK